jgi:hypothetical protein
MIFPNLHYPQVCLRESNLMNYHDQWLNLLLIASCLH